MSLEKWWNRYNYERLVS